MRGKEAAGGMGGAGGRREWGRRGKRGEVTGEGGRREGSHFSSHTSP